MQPVYRRRKSREEMEGREKAEEKRRSKSRKSKSRKSKSRIRVVDVAMIRKGENHGEMGDRADGPETLARCMQYTESSCRESSTGERSW